MLITVLTKHSYLVMMTIYICRVEKLLYTSYPRWHQRDEMRLYNDMPVSLEECKLLHSTNKYKGYDLVDGYYETSMKVVRNWFFPEDQLGYRVRIDKKTFKSDKMDVNCDLVNKFCVSNDMSLYYWNDDSIDIKCPIYKVEEMNVTKYENMYVNDQKGYLFECISLEHLCSIRLCMTKQNLYIHEGSVIFQDERYTEYHTIHDFLLASIDYIAYRSLNKSLVHDKFMGREEKVNGDNVKPSGTHEFKDKYTFSLLHIDGKLKIGLIIVGGVIIIFIIRCVLKIFFD